LIWIKTDSRQVCHGECQPDGEAMDRAWLIWLIGVPLPIVILLFLFWFVVF